MEHWNIKIWVCLLLREKLLHQIQRFICVQKLQKNKECDDFEVRFCCPEIYQSNETSNIKPVFNETLDLEQLNDINDLRK